MAKQQKHRFGKLPPRYTFILNPHPIRCSTCPKCNRKTSQRKFPLWIMIQGADPIVLGKTCRYCATCELVICHKDELEAHLAAMFGPMKPEVLGNDYFVIGTFDSAAYKKGLKGESRGGDPRAHLADFKHHLELEYQPAGWYRDDERR